MLWWIFFKLRPDTKLSKVHLAGAHMRAVIEYLQNLRTRVVKQYGEGNMGLTDDLDNIEAIATQYCFNMAWEAPEFACWRHVSSLLSQE